MEVENALSLEDLFLSREFGQSMEGISAVGSNPDRPYLTMHERRNRKYAAAGGVAAAVLVALGLVVTAGHSPKPGGTAAIGNTGAGKNHPKTDGPPVPTSRMMLTAATVSDNGSGTAAQADVAGPPAHSGVSATSATVSTISTSAPVTSGSTSTGSSGGGTAPAPAPAPTTGSSGDALAPVTDLAGNAVTTVGTTATSAADGLAATTPALAPVTSTVGSAGGSISALGNALMAAAV
jgi:hypothetical protein